LAQEEFYDFEKALRELRMEEEELKRLVSEGEIRAFRSRDQMKFRKEDIDRLKGARGRRGKMDFRTPTGERKEETLADELVFDEGESGGDEGMATAQISSQDTIVDEPEPEPEPIRPARPARPAPPPAKSTGPRPRTTTSSRMSRMKATEAKGESVGMLAMVLLSTVMMLISCMVLYNAAKNQNTGMTRWLTDAMMSTFGGQ